MSRRISTKKRFPERDSKYDNFLVSLLINRIMRCGKKLLSKRIISKAFEFIELKTSQSDKPAALVTEKLTFYDQVSMSSTFKT